MAVYLNEMVSRSRCPEPQVLAAYIDRRLSMAERAQVEAHLGSCPECIELVAQVVRTVAELTDFTASEEPIGARVRRPYSTMTGLLAAAATVVAVLAMPWLMRPWIDGETKLASLLGSAGEQRPVLGRLTGGFPHAALTLTSAREPNRRAAAADRILLASVEVRDSFGERGTPSRLHALGVSQLFDGRLDDAARSLLAASREQPDNARYLNDLAATQLERARLGLRPDDLPRALASAERARRLDPSLREAWFNRALATTALSLTDQAKLAWREYLAQDNESPWATEARARLEELSKPTAAAMWAGIEQRLKGPIDTTLADDAVRTQTTEARNFLENELLPHWAEAVQAGGSASEEIDRVRTMADAFARITGDGLYKDVVLAIDRAEARGRDAQMALARAHQRFAKAAEAFARDRFADARPGFVVALEELKAAGSPLSIRADIELGAIAYISGTIDEAQRSFARNLATARARGYGHSAARCTWYQALIAFGQGRLGDTQAGYEETLATFERMGDAEQVAAVHNLLAGLFDYLSDETLAWQHRLAALPVLDRTRSPRLRFQILLAAAGAVRRQDSEAAEILQGALIDEARRSGRPAAIAESLSQRAESLVSLGRAGDAESTLADARRALQEVDAALRPRIEVSVLAAESALRRRTSPEQAVRAATRAIQLIDARRDRRRLAQLNLRLAKANIAWGRLDEAGAALARGITAFEEERASLGDDGRLSTLDESWGLFDAAVHLAIKNKDYERAFALSERARARTLAESRSTPARSLKDVERTIPNDHAILALSQFDDELAIWLIRGKGTTVVTRPMTRIGAARLVARQQEEISREASRPTASATLYNEIIRPVASQLVDVSRLIVVPDSAYETASFAALWNSARGRFLVEDVTISMAVTVSGYQPAAQPRSAGRLIEPLILSGPADAAYERAAAVASAYASPELVTGPTATRSRLLTDADDHQIVHLAARVSSNTAFPLLSRVMLADDTGQRHSGAVLAREIAARPRPRTDLVVIDNVEASSTDYNGGTLSVTRAFVAAGVPAVVGTLPGADEKATRELLVDFHRQMATGTSAPIALSTLQRNVLHRNGRRLGAWCALVLYGSGR